MTITSTAFQDNEPIPKEYGFDQENISPPLTFSEVPVEAKSLALIVEDPDAPTGTFTHWIVVDMNQGTLQVPEGELPRGARQLTNDFGNPGYGGPKPPSGTHRYIFKLFALDATLDDLREEDTAKEFNTAVEDHILSQANITGVYAAS